MREEELAYWKVRQVLEQNPELLIDPAPDRRDEIRNLIIHGKRAYIGVRTSSKFNMNQWILFGLKQAISSTEWLMEDDYSETKKCRIVKAKNNVNDANTGYMTRKRSPLLKIFDKKYEKIGDPSISLQWN